jgi:hypothetical protein
MRPHDCVASLHTPQQAQSGVRVLADKVHFPVTDQGPTQGGGGGGSAAWLYTRPNRNLKTDFEGLIILNVLRDFPFRWNQPLKSADD